jgi:hypothetical protein
MRQGYFESAAYVFSIPPFFNPVFVKRGHTPCFATPVTILSITGAKKAPQHGAGATQTLFSPEK